jgi:hypothetical protein
MIHEFGVRAGRFTEQDGRAAGDEPAKAAACTR